MATAHILSIDQKRLIRHHQIYILGGITIQNQLMRDLFQYELQLYPGLSPDIKAFPVSSNLNGGRRLVLIDCLDRDMDNYLSGRELAEYIVPHFQLVAFFNLLPQWGREREAINLGVKGFFYRTDNLEILGEGVFTLFTEGLWIPRGALFEPLEDEERDAEELYAQLSLQPPNILLTRREKQILHNLGRGLRNRNIAEELGIGEATVKTHIYNIYKKIGVRRRSEAVLWAVRHNCLH